MQSLRLYFPSFQATQIVCGVNTSYAKEITKFRTWGQRYLTPHLRRSRFLQYPYKITIVFYSYSPQDAVTTLTLAAYIAHLFESNAVLQSTDYRVTPEYVIKMEKVNKVENEGCEIFIDRIMP